jgi:polyhydroxyalkanoate synthesis repressor PhaR
VSAPAFTDAGEDVVQKSQPRLIKRYNNRKLYDQQKSRYITLEGIRELVKAGIDVRVIDNDTGEDLTRVTFAQIIYEGERRRDGLLSLPALRWVVERGDEAVRDLRRGVERSREAFESVREATEKRVQELVERSGERSRQFWEELLGAPQRRLDQLQRRIDTQLRQSVELFTKNPAIRAEVKRVEKSIRQLEQQLTRLTRRAPAAKRGRKRAGG